MHTRIDPINSHSNTHTHLLTRSMKYKTKKNVNKQQINASDRLTSFIKAAILGLLNTLSFSSSGVRYLSFWFGIFGVHTLVMHGNRFGSNKLTNAFIESDDEQRERRLWWRTCVCKYYAVFGFGGFNFVFNDLWWCEICIFDFLLQRKAMRGASTTIRIM